MRLPVLQPADTLLGMLIRTCEAGHVSRRNDPFGMLGTKSLNYWAASAVHPLIVCCNDATTKMIDRTAAA